MEHVKPTDVPRDAQLVDCREPNEFAEVHAQGAVNLPLSNFAALTNRIDFDQPVYIICAAGARSVEAAQYLEEIFDAEVYNIEGGTREWVDKGLPTEQ